MDFVGIDTGRFMTDAAGELGVKSFPSKYGSGRPLSGEAGDTTLDYNIVLDGKNYFVGWLANEAYDRRRETPDSKLTLQTKVLFFTALAAVTQDRQPNITTTVPIKHHKIETKLLLKSQITGRHKISVNGGPEITYDIEDFQIVKEDYAAWWNAVLDDRGYVRDQALMKRPVTRGIGCNSRMINYFTLENGVYLHRSGGSLEYGCMELELDGNDPEQLARRIWGDLLNVWTDVKKTDTLFLNGRGVNAIGSILAKEFFTCVIAEDPGTDNARGARKLGIVNARNNLSVARR